MFMKKEENWFRAVFVRHSFYGKARALWKLISVFKLNDQPVGEWLVYPGFFKGGKSFITLLYPSA